MSGWADKTSSGRGTIAGNRGFSLVELVVVMGIFLTVMLITSNAFKVIANNSSQQSKSLETQIEGIVGLEVLRADLEQAGFGLPWTFQSTIDYVESTLDSNNPQAGYWPSGDPTVNFNDADGVPRAILSSNTKFNIDAANNGAKYIVIKSTTAATNDTAKRWTNISYAGGVKTIKSWGDASRDFDATDRVIVIKNNLNTTPTSRQLRVNSGNYYAAFNSHTTLIKSPVDGDTYQVYGVGTANLGMPFNRADYYVMTPTTMPQGCAPKTGVLYKANISHTSGKYAPIAGIPLVDCVADMQIVYGLDTDNGGRVNLHTTTAPATADDQRAQIKEIRVYILAQDGKRDVAFTYPSPTVDVGESFDGGATIAGKRFDLQTLIGTGWQNYRWKVYSIVVRPKNLIQ